MSRRVHCRRIRLLTFVVLLINRFAIVSTYQRSDLFLLGLDLTYRVEDEQLGDASGACEASIFGNFQEGEESLPEPNNRAVPDSLV